MTNIFDTYRPDGFSTVNPYIFADDPEGLIDFLKRAFQAKEVNRSTMPNGEIANCIVKVGDSCFMISQARDQFLGMRTSFYLFVDDVDEIYNRALEQGAKSELKPMDMSYEDRQGGIVDPAGNYWWISRRLKEEPYSD